MNGYQSDKALGVQAKVLRNAASVSPGGSPGYFHLEGDYEQTADGTFNVELRNAGVRGSDSMEVFGNVKLAGKLSVSTLPGFNGNTFTILECLNKATKIDGTFANLPEGGVLAIGGDNFRITYKGGRDGNDVVLTRMPALMNVRMSWSPSGDKYASDFDMGATFLGGQAGWNDVPEPGSYDAPYMDFSGDVILGGSGYEETLIDVFGALDDQQWSGSADIVLTGAWWSDRPDPDKQTDFNVDLLITWNGVTLERRGIEVLEEDYGFATGFVGTITVLADGTFSYSGDGTEPVAPTAISLSSATVDENSPAGTVVGTLSASSDSAVTFALVAGLDDNDKFEIVGNQLRTLVPLDFERPFPYAVQIEARDAEGDFLQEAFTISVNDINDDPWISASSFEFSVSESVIQGRHIGTIVAADQEAASLAFTLLGDSGPFDIDGNGNIFLAGMVDYESQSVYQFTVQVSDGQSSASATVIISATNSNEAPIVSQSQYDFSIGEHAAVGSAVGAVVVADPEGDGISYWIIGGDGMFSIDGNGVVRIAQELDFESAASYDIVIGATDGDWYSHVPLTITVGDLNDAPFFDTSELSFVVYESEENNTVVGAVAAFDPDAGATLTYSLGSGSGPFAVATDGMITLTGPLDFDAQAIYDLTIIASDGNGGTATIDVRIDVGKVVNAAIAVGSAAQLLIYDNGANGTAFTHDFNEPFGLPSGLAPIDNGDGVLLIDGIASEGTGGYYSFEVTADDNNGTFTYILFNLTISESPLQFTTASNGLALVKSEQSYSDTVAVTGGWGERIFSLVGGELPEGLTLDPGNRSRRFRWLVWSGGAEGVWAAWLWCGRGVDQVESGRSLGVGAPWKKAAIDSCKKVKTLRPL